MIKRTCIFICLLALLSGCAPKQLKLVAYFDYAGVANRYSVHFRHNDNVNFDYELLGSFYILETSGYVEVTRELPAPAPDKKGDAIYGDYDRSIRQTKPQSIHKNATGQSVLEMAAQTAVSQGADYILNMDIKPTMYQGEVAFEAAGLLVKRKD